MHGSQRQSAVLANRRWSIRAWQDRFRDPNLTVLLVLEACLIFLAAPLAAKGVPLAKPITETMVLAVVMTSACCPETRCDRCDTARSGSRLGDRLSRVEIAAACSEPLHAATSHFLYIVGMLSQRRGAIAAILLGLAAILAAVSLGSKSPPPIASTLRRGGDILTFLALSWVVSHAVYAPGRITFHRLQGAAVLYLNVAIIFAAAFTLIWELSPAAFSSPQPRQVTWTNSPRCYISAWRR